MQHEVDHLNGILFIDRMAKEAKDRPRSALEFGRAVAPRLLDANPDVERVRYPGLPDDPGHTRVRAFMDGAGAVPAPSKSLASP